MQQLKWYSARQRWGVEQLLLLVRLDDKGTRRKSWPAKNRGSMTMLTMNALILIGALIVVFISVPFQARSQDGRLSVPGVL